MLTGKIPSDNEKYIIQSVTQATRKTDFELTTGVEPGISVVKPKLKQLQWPITAHVNNVMNQWELEENARDGRQAREIACDQVAIGFGFASDWLSR